MLFHPIPSHARFQGSHAPGFAAEKLTHGLTERNRYIPVVYCLNKIDSISIEELDLLYRIPNSVPISSEHGWNLDELMESMWEKLNLKRVYTKPKGRQPDYSAPVVLRANRCTVEDFVS
jgi:ribosome-interacting GTPase 1